MKRMRSALAYVLLLALIAALCGWVAINYLATFKKTEPVHVMGTITRGGKPLEWRGEDGILFIALVTRRSDDINLASTDRRAGRFWLDIEPGEYRVWVRQLDPKEDRFANYFGRDNSPLRCQVTHDGQDITIDLPIEIPE